MENEKFQPSITAFETKTNGALEFESTFGVVRGHFVLRPRSGNPRAHRPVIS